MKNSIIFLISFITIDLYGYDFSKILPVDGDDLVTTRKRQIESIIKKAPKDSADQIINITIDRNMLLTNFDDIYKPLQVAQIRGAKRGEMAEILNPFAPKKTTK